jgi:hypothetical protein
MPLEWKTNYGLLRIYNDTYGHVVKINDPVEKPAWWAYGIILDDGKIFVIWNNPDYQRGIPGKLALGLYQIKGDEFVGHWGWQEEVSMDRGMLHGRAMSDVIRREK